MTSPGFLLIACGLSVVLSAEAARFDPFPPPGSNLGDPSLADRLRLEAVPLKWRELTQGGERVVYLGDMPMYRETKRYLAAVIGDMAEAGFTHLGVEAGESSQPHFDRFCAGRDEGRTAKIFEAMGGADVAASTLELFRAACAAGLRFVALEPGAFGESAMARRLAQVLSREPSARVLAFLRRHHVSTDAQPAALQRLGFSSRSYTFLTSGVEEPGGAAYFGGASAVRVTEPQDRRYYLALDAAGLRNAPLLLPCPPKIGAHGCLALPPILDERVSAPVFGPTNVQR